MKRSDLLDCKYHNRPFVPQWQRAEKCGCKSCIRSSIDTKHADEVKANHITGCYCKEWTQCMYCSMLKHFVKVLRHFGGVCSKRCPVCRWPEKTQQKAERNLQHYRKMVYWTMLKGPRKIRPSSERYGIKSGIL